MVFDQTRRYVLRAFCAALTGSVATFYSRETLSQTQDEGISERIQRFFGGPSRTMSDSEIRQEMKRAREEDAREVERLYSTKPIRFQMAGREYVVPVNYFTPKGRDEAEGGESKGFGFFLFLPAYGGYTKENWQDRFDRRLITVLQVSPVNKNAMEEVTDGTRRRVLPSSYGEPQAAFKVRQHFLEEKPAFRLHGLEGYRYKGGGRDDMVWTGVRSNGEFFFFESSLAVDRPVTPGVYPSNPSCKVNYYCHQEDLRIHYFYSQDQIARWREIDDAIWAKMHAWRMK